jgi:hypothetical protein
MVLLFIKIDENIIIECNDNWKKECSKFFDDVSFENSLFDYLVCLLKQFKKILGKKSEVNKKSMEKEEEEENGDEEVGEKFFLNYLMKDVDLLVESVQKFYERLFTIS